MNGRLALIGVVALLAAGCSSSGGKSGSAGATEPVGGLLIGGMTNCLTDENWIVQPEADSLVGTSDKGVNFKIDLFASPSEAKAHKGKNGIVVGIAVVDYTYESGQSIGVEVTAIKPTTETATIKKCLGIVAKQ